MHISSVIVGFTGVISFVVAIVGNVDNNIFGITKIDTLLCSGILVLIAIWLAIGTIHHMMLEKNGEVV